MIPNIVQRSIVVRSSILLVAIPQTRGQPEVRMLKRM